VHPRILSSGGFLIALVAFTGACRRTPRDLREWTASDHDQADEQNPSRAAPAKSAAPAGSAANPMTALVELAWRNQCAPCHGPRGRGDGPQGPMLHAPDLTSPEWQAKVTDEQIKQVVVNGKNRMPKFELPPEILTGLVARIRATKGK
jgi:cytochrome c oxidase cbb3-type subunit 3